MIQLPPNLLFDFGNVLFDIDMSVVEKQFRQLTGDRFEGAWAELQRQRVFLDYETGGLTTDSFLEAICEAARPVALSPEQVADIWNSIFIQLPKERLDLMLHLRHHHQVFMLSNINPLHADWIDAYMLRAFGIDHFQSIYFDAVYYSHLIRFRKPDAAAFEYVLADAEIRAEDTLFIDDMPQNVAAAQVLGFQGIVHTPHSPLDYLMS